MAPKLGIGREDSDSGIFFDDLKVAVLERFRGVDFGYVPIGSVGLAYLPTSM